MNTLAKQALIETFKQRAKKHAKKLNELHNEMMFLRLLKEANSLGRALDKLYAWIDTGPDAASANASKAVKQCYEAAREDASAAITHEAAWDQASQQTPRP